MIGPLLVLGASEEQVPLYREARRRGVRTIAVDRRRDQPAVPLADAFLEISTRDPAAIVAALGSTRPAGVVSAASDAGLFTWHELSHRYRTPYRYPRRAAEVSADKGAFHELMRAAGVPGHGWARSSCPVSFAEQTGALTFPLVVKPNDGSGSRGIVRVRHRGELSAAFAHAGSHSPDGVVIAEECVEGRHLTLELFMRAGEPRFASVTERRFVPGTDFVVGSHTCPASLDPATEKAIVDTTARLCVNMDLLDGPANFDAVLTPGGRVHLIEVNARLGGNGLPRMLRAAYGIDNIGALVSLALGEPFDLAPTRNRSAALRLLGSPLGVEGTLTGVGGLAEARATPGVTELEIFARPGDLVRPFTQSGHKLGHLVVSGASPEEADRALRDALRALRLDIVPCRTTAVRPPGRLAHRP